MNQPRPLFIDTNAFVALANEEDEHHETAHAIRTGIADGKLNYGPLFTSRYVLSETATTILYAVGHGKAVEVLTNVRQSSSINILDVGEKIFDQTAIRFEQYDDQQISYIDHMNVILTEEYNIEHIFAFDRDFATLGLTRVPVDTNEL